MVRQLKVPVGFSADLPFGPMPQTGCPRVLCETGTGENARNAITFPIGEDGGFTKNTRGGRSTGALCYRSPYPLPAIGNGGDNHDNKDARLRQGPGSHEDGGLAENTGGGSTGALCYCDPDPLSVMCNGGDNYDNNDVRSLAELWGRLQRPHRCHRGRAVCCGRSWRYAVPS